MYLSVDMVDSHLVENLKDACTKAEHVVAQQVLKDTAPFVPMLTGALNMQSGVEGNVIYYRTPYARFLYYGKLMVDPDTGSAWAKAGATKVVTDKNLVFNHAFHPQAQAHWVEASHAMNQEKWRRVAAKAVSKYGNE